MKSEKATFPGAKGTLLSARLDSPDGPVRAHALFAHCFTCNKDIFAASRIIRSNQTTNRLANITVALVVIQLAAGALNVWLLAPVWMQILHLFLADALWIALVLLSFQTLVRSVPAVSGLSVVQ